MSITIHPVEVSRPNQDLINNNIRLAKVEQRVGEHATKIGLMQEEVNSHEERLTEVEKTVEQKAPKNGYAPELLVKFAEELVGRGVAEPQEIGKIRPTGVISIGDGNATIEKVKGKSVVWNQKYPTGWKMTQEGITSVSTDYEIVLNGVCDNQWFNIKNPSNKEIPLGHTAVFSLFILKDDLKQLQGKCFGLLNRQPKYNTIESNYTGFIYKNTNSSLGWSLGFSSVAAGDTLTDVRIRVTIHDLTQMFGEGNEPTTIEEFHARKPLNIDEYAYNEGELISNNAKELKSVGFNAWDGQLKSGYLNGDGFTIGDGSSSHTSNFVKVIQGATYYKNKTNFNQTTFYDRNKSFLEGKWLNSGEFTIPNDCHFIKVDFPTADADSFCIHLVHTGYRNGEYEPYKEFRRSIPIKSIKDSDGNQLFPYGLLSAGSVYDEITATKAIKRVNRVVLNGSEQWYLQSINSYGIANFYILLPKFDNGKSAISDKLHRQTGTISVTEDEGFLLASEGTLYIRIKSTTASTAEQFKAWLSQNNVIVQTGLAEPIEVDLPEPLNLTYDAWDFGTEELLATGTTTQLCADVNYVFNAVDRIRENTEKNKALEEEVAQLKAMLTQMTQANESNEA